MEFFFQTVTERSTPTSSSFLKFETPMSHTPQISVKPIDSGSCGLICRRRKRWFAKKSCELRERHFVNFFDSSQLCRFFRRGDFVPLI